MPASTTSKKTGHLRPSKRTSSASDDRLSSTSPWIRLFTRSEIGAACAAIAVFIFFSFAAAPVFTEPSSIATTLYGASTIGIVSVGVSLLMIGGEFDLSAGVGMISVALFAGLSIYWFSLNVWVGVVLSLIYALLIGLFNGWMLVKTQLVSFLVTLGTFFMITGLNLGVTRLISRGVASPSVGNMDGYDGAHKIFAADIPFFGIHVTITVFYWIVLVIVGTWILQRTTIGNWIFAVGGAPVSARSLGVPVNRTKIGLFMGVSFCAWLVAMHQLFEFKTVQSGEGVGNELIYIMTAVVGGCLLTGGYGSVIGGALGAFIYGVALKGIVYANWSPDWLKFFLGALLVAATVFNLFLRQRASQAK